MKKIISFLFSMFFTGLLLVIFAAAIAYATFIENDYGTLTAKILIYNSWWFEVLLLIIIINLSGSIIINKLASKKKWTIFLFHVAFIFIIIGAALTRYCGFEGTMHIREGESSNSIISTETYIQLTATANGQSKTSEKEVKFTGYTGNRYSEKMEVSGKTVHIKNLQFMPSATELILKDVYGEPIIALTAFSQNIPRADFSLNNKEIKYFDGVSFGFKNEAYNADLNFSENDGIISFTASDSVTIIDMMNNESETIAPEITVQPNGRKIYQIKNISFVFKQFYPAGRVQLSYMPQENGNFNYDAFLAKITVDNESTEVTVSGTTGLVGEPHYVFLNGVKIEIRYGSKNIELPFSLKLNDFQLDRYPGSNSPSSYASEVVLIDRNDGIEEPFRIFMNNILKYKGYRFFQSSYDPDEEGTVLSVNSDQAGTSVTYFGYLILAIGMVLTLFNRNSRFKKLIRASAKLHEEKKKLLIVLLIGLSGFFLSAQASAQEHFNKEQVQEFSQLLIQNNRGRIEPVNTLASDILRKVAKKSNIDGIPAAEVFLEMQINPEKWKNVPIIKVGNPELRSRLGATQKLVAFNQIVTPQQSGGYKLAQLVQQAYAKSPAKRNKFDKEVINVDERVNILMNVFSGNFLTIFPIPGHENNKWVAYQNIPSLGNGNAEWAKNAYNQYFSSLIQAMQSGDWRSPGSYLDQLKENQIKYASHIAPSKTKIKLEVFYNNFNIFGKLSKFYLLGGFALLILQLITLFNPKIKIEKLKTAGVVLAILLFTAHTAGLALRWYISGHAPWSNGYESMIFIGWATVLSGLVFIKRSQITLALTLVLAALTLLVAGMSWMSPEITNLVPVLKSYWLIVHVAIITASYGFLGISALLGALNLILITTRSEKNSKRINLTIKELAYIIQMALIIGLYMVTLGSFIGGVWANESWGRYWGWDPKETWALVTVLVYSFIIHMHKIKGFRGTFALSTAALVGFSSVLMTYFGVNYYLSGLHSYAQGEPAPVPAGVYIAIFVVFLLIISAYFSEKMWKTKTKALEEPDIDIDKLE